MIRLEGAAASHVGKIRPVNQDRALFSQSIAAVADGMGGHAGGEQAATLAIGELSGVRGIISLERLMKVAEAANRRIFEQASDPSLRGMGTTLVAASADPEKGSLNIVNVGDSRAYRFRNGGLEQLTVDHSLVEDLVREGRLTKEEALTHPQRNIVTRALGISSEVEVDTYQIDVEAGDRYILCSDGLFNEVDDASIIGILEGNANPNTAAGKLVDEAVERGGRDNVTVVLVDVKDVQAGVIDPAQVEEDRDITKEELLPGVADGALGPRTEEVLPVHAPDAPVAEPTPTPASPPPPGDDDSTPPPPDDPMHRKRPAKRRWLPFRSTMLLGLLVISIIGLGIGGSAVYARSAYYVDDVDGSVVILRGRPGGVLFFDPSEVEDTGLAVDALDGASRELLRNRTQWSSVDDARAFVSNLSSADTATG